MAIDGRRDEILVWCPLADYHQKKAYIQLLDGIQGESEFIYGVN